MLFPSNAEDQHQVTDLTRLRVEPTLYHMGSAATPPSLAIYDMIYAIYVTYAYIMTRRDGRMSRASITHFGKLEDPDLAVFEPWSSQIDDFKTDTRRFLARCFALLG